MARDDDFLAAELTEEEFRLGDQHADHLLVSLLKLHAGITPLEVTC